MGQQIDQKTESISGKPFGGPRRATPALQPQQPANPGSPGKDKGRGKPLPSEICILKDLDDCMMEEKLL